MKLPSLACGLALALLGAGPGLLPAQTQENEKSARMMRLDKFVVPDFPEFLRRSGVLEGTVAAAIGHDANGKPDDILVLESTDPRFTDAAVEAIQAWRFETPGRPPLPREAVVPVVRFLFTSGNVSVMSLSIGTTGAVRGRVRADSPVELPNFTHLDAQPKPTAQPMPKLAAPRAGTALVKFFVDTEGRVRVPIVVNASAPELGEAALAAVRQWRFEPPRIDGKPVIAIEAQLFRFGEAGNDTKAP